MVRVLTLKHREMHGCIVSTVATDALVLKEKKKNCDGKSINCDSLWVESESVLKNHRACEKHGTCVKKII